MAHYMIRQRCSADDICPIEAPQGQRSIYAVVSCLNGYARICTLSVIELALYFNHNVVYYGNIICHPIL